MLTLILISSLHITEALHKVLYYRTKGYKFARQFAPGELVLTKMVDNGAVAPEVFEDPPLVAGEPALVEPAAPPVGVQRTKQAANPSGYMNNKRVSIRAAASDIIGENPHILDRLHGEDKHEHASHFLDQLHDEIAYQQTKQGKHTERAMRRLTMMQERVGVPIQTNRIMSAELLYVLP